MQKTYKKIILLSRRNTQNGSAADKEKVSLASLLTLPAIVIGSLTALVFISAFIAMLLIPGSILGFLAWRRFKKLRQQTATKANDEILEAEYTIIKDSEKK
jgi:Flp pilus assembly protein TadB